jgi:asparagine synthase (glutamine-hydrolysing)
MCGICGELRFDGAQPRIEDIEKMSAQLARRGPDDSGHYQSGPVAFGHRRLSIIDLSSRSHQPMLDDQLHLDIVFNGTIYNYKELRAQLIDKGYRFFSQGDTEVIIKAYAEWSDKCVEHLHGIFAFAIWDRQQQRLFMARDRLGIKPLYYSRSKNYFRFASNSQALLAAGGVDTQIDPVALHHHLTLHAVVPAPRTIFLGLRKLSPATTLSINAKGDVQTNCYWQLSLKQSSPIKHEIEWIDLIHDALREAIHRRKVIADVPVGVLLSGGLDSSLLVALLVEAGVDDLRTFSIGFEDVGQERGDEFEYSDQVVNRYQTQHEKIVISNDEVLKRLPETVESMAEPMVAQDAIGFYLLAEKVSEQVKVVQSGQGADEVFAGYFWYPLMEQESGNDLERFARHYFDRSHEEFLQTVSSDFHGDDFTSLLVEELLGKDSEAGFIERVLRMDVTTLIVDDPVKRVDNMTMAWGLEARVPFLDHKLVELVAQMPAHMKLKSGGKHPLKYIARGLLPDAVIDRRKGYFPMPALKYVQGEFLEFMRDVLDSSACRQRGLFSRPYVDKLLSEPQSHFTKLNGSKLWHLALLEYWLQRIPSLP